ncbi:MAG: hypothetical protein CMI70_04085 [Candidatus Pelagibacter sp.]|jgi:hypothetical protein|nr:hypothetical protein [Candidatus Pelagibacter sp.]MDP6440601.1 hypothetical protein [Pelagibacteraceae bacterium]|tara:strand:- start:28098 stop:28613 length:516 start_codon:yes stop_codon:yes gene_type:complete
MRNILILITLISGLIFTSLIKNKTRLLEKELLYLDNEINVLSTELGEASLDFHYLTTPERISLLAKNFLNENFMYYKESQIKKSIKLGKDLVILTKPRNNHTFSKLSTRKFANKKTSIIEEIDSEELLTAKRIDNRNPQKSKKIISSKKVQQWAGIQIIKAFLGIPTIPFK